MGRGSGDETHPANLFLPPLRRGIVGAGVRTTGPFFMRLPHGTRRTASNPWTGKGSSDLIRRAVRWLQARTLSTLAESSAQRMRRRACHIGRRHHQRRRWATSHIEYHPRRLLGHAPRLASLFAARMKGRGGYTVEPTQATVNQPRSALNRQRQQGLMGAVVDLQLGLNLDIFSPRYAGPS